MHFFSLDQLVQNGGAVTGTATETTIGGALQAIQGAHEPIDVIFVAGKTADRIATQALLRTPAARLRHQEAQIATIQANLAAFIVFGHASAAPVGHAGGNAPGRAQTQEFRFFHAQNHRAVAIKAAVRTANA